MLVAVILLIWLLGLLAFGVRRYEVSRERAIADMAAEHEAQLHEYVRAVAGEWFLDDADPAYGSLVPLDSIIDWRWPS